MKCGWRHGLVLLTMALLVGALACGGSGGGSRARPADDDASPADDDASPADDDASPDDDDDDTFPACAKPTAAPGTVIRIDPADGGRRFDGYGAISSAGNSRLLIDYPEPQRSQILDYLFKPNYGAAVQVLKVEVGGDANSSSGADESHMHTADDLDCNRSYEWWLMSEAKKRNPDILLYGLAWTAPSWVRGPFCWSQEYLAYLLAWIQCGQSHGYTVDYIGGWNEGLWNRRWFISLKAALAARHWATKVVGADTHGDFGWLFPELLALDPSFAAAIDVVGVHYPCQDSGCTSSAQAIGLGKPLWASEDGASSTAVWARNINLGYIESRITGRIQWPLIASAPDGAAMSGAGQLWCNRPWSASYGTYNLFWTWAHITQFTKPGWRYLDRAVGYLQNNRNQGSYTTLLSPDGKDLTLLIEATTATREQTVEIDVAGAAPQRKMYVWTSDTSSTNNDDYLAHLCNVEPENGKLRLTLKPNFLYTVSTTFGQGKGDAAGLPPTSFPLPYENDFESDAPGREAHWLATQEGSFEVGPCGGGRTGQCVLQTARDVPVFWGGPRMLDTPFTLVGDGSLTDVAVKVDAMLENGGAIRLLGRYNSQVAFYLPQHDGYEFSLAADGGWEITRADVDQTTVLASGAADAWPDGAWRTLEFTLQGSHIAAAVDGVELAAVTDATYAAGEAGFGLAGKPGEGWLPAQFDNLSVTAPGATAR